MEAYKVRNDTVCTSDNKKIGTIVNILFDSEPDCLIAYILVFPREKNWIWQQLEDNWGGLTIGFIERNLTDLPSNWNEIKKRGINEAQRVWTAYMKDNEQKKQLKHKICYLIPIDEINNLRPSDSQVILRDTFESIQNKYCFIGDPQVCETLIPLFATPNIPTRETLLPITLNLSPVLQGLKVRDVNSKPGWIDGVQLSIKDGVINSLIIKLVGKTGGKYLVNPQDFNFDTLRCLKTFSDYRKLGSSKPDSDKFDKWATPLPV